MKVVTVEQMRQLEAAIDESLFSYQQLMQAAGQSAADYLIRRLDINAQTTITFLIGKGNNGGDGLVMAYELASRTKAQIRLYLLEARSGDDVNFAAVSDDGLFVANATDDHDMRLLKSMISSSDVVVDALFGIGLRLPMRGTAAKLLRTVNLLVQHRPPEEDDLIPIDGRAVAGPQHGGRPFVFAIDCPSGIDCDMGQADTNALQADETITFIAAKTGLFTFPAAKYVSELLISSLGIPASFPELKRIQRSIVDRRAAVSMLPERPRRWSQGNLRQANDRSWLPQLYRRHIPGRGIGISVWRRSRDRCNLGRSREGRSWQPARADLLATAAARWSHRGDKRYCDQESVSWI